MNERSRIDRIIFDGARPPRTFAPAILANCFSRPSSRGRYSDCPRAVVIPALSRDPPCSLLAEVDRQPCVYLLARASHSTLYTGVTSNLLGRVQQHREGAVEGFTKQYGIKRLVWFEAHETMESAILREKRIKRWPRAWKYDLIHRDNPTWRDLAEDFGFPPLTMK